MNTKACFFLAAGWVMVIANGCASSNATVVDRHRVGTLQRVEMGTVVTVKNIIIEGEQTPIGLMGGAVIGQAAGSAIGQGAGNALARAGGAVTGAIMGRKTEQVVTRKAGLEVTVQIDGGDKVVITQEANDIFQVGDRVQVISGAGIARVAHPSA